MNSRITIINEAYSSSLDFANLFDTYEKNNYLIDLEKMSFLEKAQILYNHLYFNELPNDLLVEIKKNKNYYLIVKHRNYNPRIIEYVTKPKNYNNIPSKEYVDYILSKLDNPDSVWEDEFRNRLEEYDRVLMNTIYSLTNDKIKIEILEKAFNKRIRSITNNTTLNIFNEVINRLNNSLIRIIIDKKKRYISVINPSVNDFLNKKLSNNINEQITIINNAEYIEQLIKFKENKKQIYELIYNNSIYKLNSIDKSTSYRYFEILIYYQLKDLKIKQFVQDAFKNLLKDFHHGKDDIIVELIKKSYVNFYELEDIIFNNLKDILIDFSYNNLVLLYEWIKLAKRNLNSEEIEAIKESFINAIENYILEDINYDIQDIVSSEIEALNYKINMPNGGTVDDLKELYVNKYYYIIKDDVEQEIHNRLKKFFEESPIDLNIKWIDENYILNNIDIDDSIRSYVDSEYIQLKTDNYVESEFFETNDEDWAKIDEMFS